MTPEPILYDANGQPLAPSTPAVPPPIYGEFSGVASPGTATWQLFLDELTRARDEVLEAQGRGDLRIYERLLTDDKVHPAFRQRRMAIIARELRVEPGGKDKPGGPTELDKLAADDLRRQLASLPFDRITRKMLVGAMIGRAHAECMFRQDGTRVILDKILVRRARRFEITAKKELVLIRGTERTVMPDRKFWTIVFGSEDDDDIHGLGLGAILYWPVWFKRNALRFWSVFLETLASPTPKAEVPPGMPKEKMREVMRILDQIRHGGRVIHTRGTVLGFLEAVRNSGGDYSVFIELMNKTITSICLLQTLTSDAENTGLGSNLGKVQERTMNMGAQGESDEVTESLQKGPATWLTQWNYPGADVPLIYRDFVTKEDQAASADRDVKLFSLGYRPTEKRILETYGEGYDPIPAPTVALDPTAPAFAETAAPEDGAVDRILSNGGWRRSMTPIVERIHAILDKGGTLQEARDLIGELALEEPKELADELANIVFAGRLQGNLGADTKERQ